MPMVLSQLQFTNGRAATFGHSCPIETRQLLVYRATGALTAVDGIGMKQPLNPIFDALKKGQRFHFSLLAGEVEDLKLYWNWWWGKHGYDKIAQPFTISDDDPILTQTINKNFVDTQSAADFFDDFLNKCLAKKMLPSGPAISRNEYRAHLIKILSTLAPKLETPTAILSGGGYGSGKTNVLDFMRVNGCFPFSAASVLGVDTFKLYFPEFDQIRMVADGRASDVVQAESKMLAKVLFNQLVADKRTFAWDASMASGDEPRARLKALRNAGYLIKFVAVFTPLKSAIRQVMFHAKQTRRFVSAGYVEASHKAFLEHFLSYLDYFDEIQVYYNNPDKLGVNTPPDLIAEKIAPNKNLVIFKSDLFHSFVPKSK